MTKVAVTPWFMQKHMDVLLQLNHISLQHPTPKHGMVWQMQAIQGHDTYERLPQITVPTLSSLAKKMA